MRIVRAFSYFSHLANIAEDQNHIRRTRAQRGGGAGVLAETLAHAQGGRHRRRRAAPLLRDALVSPVLTAHPTEVRRKSTMDREMEIAALLDRRERVQLTPEEAAANEEELRREVLTLWQTNLLRRTKLTVLDEVANGLSFYDYTFLREVPRLHQRAGGPAGRGRERRQRLASFLRMGSWIGGDRDGNPFVTADVMRGTLRMQSSRVLRFYLDELHVLGAELSIAAHLADVSEELRALAESSPDTSPHRRASPIASRSPASMRGSPRPRSFEVEIMRRPVGEGAPIPARGAEGRSRRAASLADRRQCRA